MLSVVFVVTLLSFTSFAVQDDYGGCICAVFPKGQTLQNPIIQHTLQLPMPCTEEGAEICNQLCFALADTAKEEVPAMICEASNQHVDYLTVLLYTKVCNTTSWKASGMESKAPICCHDGKPRICDAELHFASISNNI